MRPDELAFESALTRWDPPPAPNFSTSSMLPDLDRAERMGDFWANPRTRTFGELLIDCEEDRTLRAAGRDAAGG